MHMHMRCTCTCGVHAACMRRACGVHAVRMPSSRLEDHLHASGGRLIVARAHAPLAALDRLVPGLDLVPLETARRPEAAQRRVDLVVLTKMPDGRVVGLPKPAEGEASEAVREGR